ncbi:MAG TPA: type IV secretion system DNA-binding domain-containing protein [Candidatus Binataceae bacterium]|nr:type IV secretion system DNA-binding domain-containing protein [Candidatus Binataceae bacterium]
MAFGASEAARWQAAQTRARMGMTLWSLLIRISILLWVGATLYVIWYQTDVYWPQLHHQYFWRWVIGGLFTEVPLLDRLGPWLKLPLNGSWYPLPEATDWLNSRQLYHLPFGYWFRHFCPYTAALPLALWAIVLFVQFHRDADVEHVRGLRLLPAWRHNRQLHGGWFSRSRRTIRDAVLVRGTAPHNGIRLGTSIIPASKECEHFLITGSPGAGKSTLMRHMLHQIQARGQSAVVIDPDCEFVQEFYDEGRGDVVLNPLDERCPFWSPWLEFRDATFAMDAEAMAASLIRNQARTPTEEFFRESSRTLLEGIFQVVKERRDARVITEFLALSRSAIQKELTGTRAYPLIDPGAHEQGSGILATAANAVKPFYHLPLPEQATRQWSARMWAEQRKGWIFLSSSEDARAAIQKLQGVWLDSLVRWLMSSEIGSDQVWIMADEFPALEYQPQVEKVVTRGRKRGISVVMGFQNVSQLRSIYGRDGAITLTSSPSTKIIMRSDEAETARWASELLGSHEIVRLDMTAVTGLSTYREGINLQPHRSTEPIVSPAEIQLLKPLEGYLCFAGNDRTIIRISPRYLAKRHPAFLPRTRMTVTSSAPEPVAFATADRWLS